MAHEIPRVALLVETSLGYGRALLRGVVRYARLHGPWAFYIQPGGLSQLLPKMEEWGGTGIIARIETPAVAKAVLATRLPVIALDLNREQLAPNNPLSHLSEVCPDSHKAGVLAAEHLLDRGFRHFAFVGAWGDLPWSIWRGEGFSKRLDGSGLPCADFPMPRAAKDRRWGREQAILGQWLQKLPKPLGILACDDDRGRQVLEACRAAGLHVPEDVGRRGRRQRRPALRTLRSHLVERRARRGAGGVQRGRSARRSDERPRPRTTPHPRRADPRGNATIHRRACHRGPRLGQGRSVHSRQHRASDRRRRHRRTRRLFARALELRFRRILGRSVNEEIRQIRIERAKHLLAETRLSVTRVAETLGFGSSNYMIRLFRHTVGQSPGSVPRSTATACQFDLNAPNVVSRISQMMG